MRERGLLNTFAITSLLMLLLMTVIMEVRS
jgi:hypothetical protein